MVETKSVPAVKGGKMPQIHRLKRKMIFITHIIRYISLDKLLMFQEKDFGVVKNNAHKHFSFAPFKLFYS